MYWNSKARMSIPFCAVLIMLMALLAGCGGGDGTPEQPAVSTAADTAPAVAKVVAPTDTPTATEAPTATEPPAATAEPTDTPAPTEPAGGDASAEQRAFRLPGKGAEDAPVTIIEFSDYL